MIYTSYISNLKNIPDNYYKLIITRYNKINPKNFNNCFHAAVLSPNEQLLKEFKNGEISYQEFYDRFLKQVYNDNFAKDVIKKILDYDRKDLNVVLLCYEKDLKDCHRCIVGKILERNGGRVKYEIQT